MSASLSRCSSISSSLYDEEVWSSESEVLQIYKKVSDVPKKGSFGISETPRPIEKKERYFSYPLDKNVSAKIISSVQKCRRISEWRLPDGIPNAIYNELLRMKLQLSAYDDLVERRLFDPKLIVEQNISLGPSYADWLKDFRDYSVKITGSIQMVTDEELDIDCTEHLESWDQIFPPEYLFPFERDCSKDYELMFEDSPVPSTDVQLRFKEEARRLIRKDMHSIAPPRTDDLDFLSSMGSQSSFDLSNRKRVPKSFLLAKNGSGKPPDVGSFLVSPAWKNAAEARAAVVPTPDTLVSLLMLERMCSLVFRIKEDVFWRRDFSFLNKYLSREYDTVYMSADIKKFGLTFPTWLVDSLLSVISEEYPEWNVEMYSKAISHRHIYFDGQEEPRIPKRGFGMGMINGIGSACMAILFRVFKQNVELPEDYRLDGIFYNDDQEFRLIRRGRIDASSEELAVDLVYSWNEFCYSAGLTMHKKKPFISYNGLFCEVYGESFPVDCRKKFKRYCNLLNCITSTNIVEAKFFVSSVVPCLEPCEGYLRYFLNRIVSSFGYEFSKEECLLPFEIGGWVPYIVSGNNILLEFMTHNATRFSKYFGLVHTLRKVQADRHAPQYKKYVEQYSDWIKNNVIESVPQLDFASMLRSAIGAPNRNPRTEVKSWLNFARDRQLSLKKKLSLENAGRFIRNLIEEKISSGRGLYAVPKEFVDPEDESWIDVSQVKILMSRLPRFFDLGRTFLSLNKLMGRIDIDIYSFHEKLDCPQIMRVGLEFYLLCKWLGYEEGKTTKEMEHLLVSSLGYQAKLVAHIRSILPNCIGFNGFSKEVTSFRKLCSVRGIPLVDNNHILWAPPGTPWLRPIPVPHYERGDKENFDLWKATISEENKSYLELSSLEDFTEREEFGIKYFGLFIDSFFKKKKKIEYAEGGPMDPLAINQDRDDKPPLPNVIEGEDNDDSFDDVESIGSDGLMDFEVSPDDLLGFEEDCAFKCTDEDLEEFEDADIDLDITSYGNNSDFG